jgi:hypothetical protein
MSCTMIFYLLQLPSIKLLGKLTMNYGLIETWSLQGAEDNHGNHKLGRSTARLRFELDTLYINRTSLALGDVK